MSRVTAQWSTPEVEAVKAEVKAELDAAKVNVSPRTHLHGILRRIEALASDESSGGQLRRFVYVVSSLVHHARHGGMSRAQIVRARTLATTILFSRGVEPGSSRLAFLHGELHVVLSQIYRKDGRHWHAAWEQLQAVYGTRRPTATDAGFQALANANRALRLGHAGLAIQDFDAALAAGLDDGERERALLGRLKAHRLRGELETATTLAGELRAEARLSAEGRRELAWEELCLGLSARGDVASLVTAVGLRGQHRSGIFLLEASLWVKVLAAREPMERVITIKTMCKKPELRPQKFGAFFKAASALERCYDPGIPLARRIQDLGDALADTGRLTTVDKELLTWAAAARFLARSHAHAQARLALAEYEGLCLRLSDGRSSDVLRVMGDMLGREWYRGTPKALDEAG